MENIVVYPKNKEQAHLIKSLLKEMKVNFDLVKLKDESLLSEDDFYAKIKKSLKQAQEGKIEPLPEGKQKEFLGL